MITASKEKMMIQVKIGSLVRFDYSPLGVTENYVGRLMGIRDTVKDPIQYTSLWYSGYRTSRSQYLVTMSTPMGYRQFYTASIHNAKRLGLFARIILWISGKNFEKFAVV